MLTVNKIVAGGRGLAPALLKRAATVELDWHQRQKSRVDATDSADRALGIFLPRGSVLRGGDVLVAEDGSMIRVQAAAQPVMVIRACPQHGQPIDLARAAYHLGNRRVSVEVSDDHLKIEPDPVLAEMLERMQLIVTKEAAAFEPEGGADDAAPGHHGHIHGAPAHADHGHAHELGAAHDHAHPHEAAGKHVHGPGCGHEH